MVSPMGPLIVDPDNPRYLKNPHTGQTVYLTGTHTWVNVLDHCFGHKETMPIEEYIGILKRYNHNYARLWACESAIWDTRPDLPPILPWRRVSGHGQALDGLDRFDLSQVNPAYVDCFYERARALQEANLYCSIMMFQFYTRSPYDRYHPFNGPNNINGINADVNGDGSLEEIRVWPVPPEIWELQQALMRALIDRCHDLDNVFWEVENEPLASNYVWNKQCASYIKRYEREKGYPQHLVMLCGPGLNGLQLQDSPADMISPGKRWDGVVVHDLTQNPPDALIWGKPSLLDTDHFNPEMRPEEGIKWVWKAFTRGHHPVIMDAYSPISYHREAYQGYEPFRQQAGYTRQYAERVNLARMVPMTDLSDTRFVLADVSRAYIVYQPEAGILHLTTRAGVYHYEWFDPSIGQIVENGTVTVGNDTVPFVPPFDGHAVLFLSRIP